MHPPVARGVRQSPLSPRHALRGSHAVPVLAVPVLAVPVLAVPMLAVPVLAVLVLVGSGGCGALAIDSACAEGDAERCIEIRVWVPDAGAPEHDAGAPEHDAGAPEHDAGAPEHDAGSPEHDAGSPEHDAGSPEHDAGAPEHDAGAPEHDAGAPEHDAGVPEHDAGAPPLRPCEQAFWVTSAVEQSAAFTAVVSIAAPEDETDIQRMQVRAAAGEPVPFSFESLYQSNAGSTWNLRVRLPSLAAGRHEFRISTCGTTGGPQAAEVYDYLASDDLADTSGISATCDKDDGREVCEVVLQAQPGSNFPADLWLHSVASCRGPIHNGNRVRVQRTLPVPAGRYDISVLLLLQARHYDFCEGGSNATFRFRVLASDGQPTSIQQERGVSASGCATQDDVTYLPPESVVLSGGESFEAELYAGECIEGWGGLRALFVARVPEVPVQVTLE